MNTSKLESLVERVRSLPDGDARDTALELVQAVMDLHATGLERLMELASAEENHDDLFNRFADDPEVSCILLLHGVHPLHLEERVRRALGKLKGWGAQAELISARDSVVRVHIEGGPGFEAAVREAVAEAAPDAVTVEVEGGTRAGGFVPLAVLTAGTAH